MAILSETVKTSLDSVRKGLKGLEKGVEELEKNVLRSLESRLMRFRVSSKRGRSTVIVRSASFGITCM